MNQVWLHNRWADRPNSKPDIGVSGSALGDNVSLRKHHRCRDHASKDAFEQAIGDVTVLDRQLRVVVRLRVVSFSTHAPLVKVADL